MKKMIVSAWLISFTPIASADFAGIAAGAGVWSHDPSGEIAFQGLPIDVDDDLNVDTKTQTTAWAALEHPIPVLPNLKVRYTEFTLDGGNTLSRSIEFGGTTFSAAESVSLDADLDQYDVVLYYELLDNWINWDVGVEVKVFDGDFRISNATTGLAESTDFTGAIPMLYTDIALDIPMTGLFVGVEGAGLAYGGNQAYDFEAKAGYELSFGMGAKFGVGAEGGYRFQRLKLEDIGDLDTDLKADGPFGMVYLRASLF